MSRFSALWHTFAWYSSRQPIWSKLCLPLCLVFACVLWQISPAAGSVQPHTCAPATPPPVAGTPTPAPALPASLLINEVLTTPASTWNCLEPPGTHSLTTDSWIELFNPHNQAFDLYTAHTAISLDGTTWNYLPAGSAINAHGLLALFPLENSLTAPPPSTWHVVLAIADAVVDQVHVPLLQPDQSYARSPDGSRNWLTTNQPTIAASNAGTSPPATPVRSPTPSHASSHAISAPAVLVTPLSSDNRIQPGWTRINLPAPGQLPATSISPIRPANLAQATNATPSTLPALVLTSLLILLIAGLAWCWQLFHSP